MTDDDHEDELTRVTETAALLTCALVLKSFLILIARS
jgi:hypothetical protein